MAGRLRLPRNGRCPKVTTPSRSRRAGRTIGRPPRLPPQPRPTTRGRRSSHIAPIPAQPVPWSHGPGAAAMIRPTRLTTAGRIWSRTMPTQSLASGRPIGGNTSSCAIPGVGRKGASTSRPVLGGPRNHGARPRSTCQPTESSPKSFTYFANTSWASVGSAKGTGTVWTRRADARFRVHLLVSHVASTVCPSRQTDPHHLTQGSCLWMNISSGLEIGAGIVTLGVSVWYHKWLGQVVGGTCKNCRVGLPQLGRQLKG